MKKLGRPKKELTKSARIAVRIEQSERDYLINKFGALSTGISYLIKKEIRLNGREKNKIFNESCFYCVSESTKDK